MTTAQPRQNRSVGVGQLMNSHTMSDLLALPAEEDRMKAHGFVECSGMVICGGLPASEMPLLTSAIPLSRQEQQQLCIRAMRRVFMRAAYTRTGAASVYWSFIDRGAGIRYRGD